MLKLQKFTLEILVRQAQNGAKKRKVDVKGLINSDEFLRELIICQQQIWQGAMGPLSRDEVLTRVEQLFRYFFNFRIISRYR